jgi:DNA primase
MNYEHEAKAKREHHGPRPKMPPIMPELAADMHNYLEERLLDSQLAEENRWYVSYDDVLEPRIIIPCSNSAGIPYWQGRAMRDDVLKRYDSSVATRDDSVALVWPKAGQKAKTAVVVEGPMDALAAAGAGALGIAVMGNAPTSEVFSYIENILRSTYVEIVVVVPDLDTPILASRVAARLGGSGFAVRIVMPTAKDLAAMMPEERKLLING